MERGLCLLQDRAGQVSAVLQERAGGCNHRLVSEYSRRVLDKAKTDRVPIREQLRRAAAEILRQPAPQKKDRVKEAAHEDR